jgi:HSP20 family molecular chaperone IbpA
MEKMRREMDRIFDESFEEFRLGTPGKSFFDRAHFGSSMDVQEEGNAYVVRAYLPERNMENVNVTGEGDLLRIEAEAEESEKKQESGTLKLQRAQYAQAITLPGPVQVEKMKVEKKEGMVVVTLPKA